MPSRNIIRHDTAESYYHIYARGASKQPIFLERADYEYFLRLFKRYLSAEPTQNKVGISYPHYTGQLELLAFCLMRNHFHLLVYQEGAGVVAQFMKSLMISYCRYFNLKYKRSGALFESRYKASRVTNNEYLLHISRYIHLNPRSWKYYPYSSIIYYRKGEEPEWLSTDKVLSLHAGRSEYLAFVEDYKGYKEILENLKHELANS